MPLLSSINHAELKAYTPRERTEAAWSIDPDIVAKFGGPIAGIADSGVHVTPADPPHLTFKLTVAGYPSRDAGKGSRTSTAGKNRWFLSQLTVDSQAIIPLQLASASQPRHPEDPELDPMPENPIDRPDGVLWLFDGRVYFTRDLGLDANDVRALVNVDANRRRLTLEKAHALQVMNDDYDKPRRRESIAQAVRIEVWQRDGGRCVECQSQEKLEFDHIIPVAMGGGNTARNLQLLCEVCNRRKGASLG